MHVDTNTTIALILAAATLLGGWIGKRATAPKDHERAEELDRIAAGAVALVRLNNPNASWAKLLELAVNQIALSAGVRDRAAMERAAAAALTAAGVGVPKP